MLCLDLRLMVLEKELCEKKMKRIFEIFVEVCRLKSVECDEVMYQFSQFFDYCLDNFDFEKFDLNEFILRVDIFLYEYMVGDK